MDDTFAAVAGDLWLRWRTSAHRFTITTSAGFDVPGLEIALGVAGLPRDVRSLMETLRAGMASTTEGERDGAGRCRRVFRLEATPDRPAMACTVVEDGDTRLYSRDGRRFGPIVAVVAPAETEAALERLSAVEVTGATATDAAGSRTVRGALEGAAVGRLVDVRRLLGQDAGATGQSGTVELTVSEAQLDLTLAISVTASAPIAEGIGFHSTTRLRCTDLDDPGITVTVPRVSLSLPSIDGLSQALRLMTPRGPRATKRRRSR